MGGAVFAFTLGAFLKVERVALRRQFDRPARLGLMFAWVVFGVPLVAWAVLRLVPLDEQTKVGVMLCMLAPPVGSAAAIAAMLELDAALALTVTVLASLSAPLLLPSLAATIGAIDLELDASALMWRLGLLIAGAALTATALRRFAGAFVAARPQAMTGISVLGLIVVAIGAMRGMDAQLAHQAGHVGEALLVAFVVNASFQGLGLLLFRAFGAKDAATIGLLSGNRNVTLIWVAALPWLQGLPGVALFLAAAVFPIFMLPLPIARLQAWRRGQVGAPLPAAPRLGPDRLAARRPS